MSEEQLKAFIAKVQADTSLQEQLKTEGADHIAIAKAAGFVITEEEVNAYQARELSDEELESVAGGGTKGIRCRAREYELREERRLRMERGWRSK